MKRLLIYSFAIVLLCAACASAQSWFWFMDGSTDPVSTLTSEGKVAWTYNGGGEGVSWSSVTVAGDNKAFRIVDDSTSKKPRWDSTDDAFPDNVSDGMTVAFGIKGYSASTDATIIQFTTQPISASPSSRIKVQFKIGVRNDRVVLFNADATATQWIIDDAFHNFWIKARWDGSNNVMEVYKDGELVQTYAKNSSTASGKLGVDSGEGTATYELDYIGYSLDGAWNESDLPVVPFTINAGPNVSIAPDRLTATVNWQTNLPGESCELHYGTDASCPNVVSAPSSGATSYELTFPLEADKPIYYYVVTNLTGYLPAISSVRSFNNYVVNENVDNGSFEDPELGPWIRYGAFDGLHNDFGVPAYDGNMWAGAVANWGKKDRGGLRQTIGTVPGQFYIARAYIWTRRQAGAGQEPSSELQTACRIGIDPTGGTYEGGWNGLEWVENPDIAWSPWAESPNAATEHGGIGGPWVPISVGVKATGTTATLYLMAQQMWPIEWNITGFDNVTLEPAPPPPANIGGAKGVQDGWPAELAGKVVTAAWPDEMRFYIQETDRSSGILVEVTTPEHVPAKGSLATLSGYMATASNGERFIKAYNVLSEDGGTLPDPVGMRNRDLGPLASGLLCTIWGRVMPDPENPWYAEILPDSDPNNARYDPYAVYNRFHFYLDDGSGVPGAYIMYTDDGTQWYSGGSYKGVKVYFHGLGYSQYMPQPGDFIRCTGVAGYEWSDNNWTAPGGDVTLVRTLEVREIEQIAPGNFGDIVVLP